MYRDDEQGKRKTQKDNCNSYNNARIKHIHQSHKVYYCFKKYQQLRPGLLVINQTNFMMYPPSSLVLSLTCLRALGWKEGAGRKVGQPLDRGLYLPCQEKGVRTLALHSKSWISSLQKINKGNEVKIFFHTFRSYANPPLRERFASCLDKNILTHKKLFAV